MLESFQPPRLTPEQFYDKLKQLVARMKAESEWKELAFFTRYAMSNLDDDFALMIEPLIGKDLRK